MRIIDFFTESIRIKIQMQKKGKHIVFIGMSGSGKSTLGRELSTFLNLSFLDTDSEIEKRRGLSIVEIFEKEGEEQFRAYEFELINELLLKPRCIIAVGGGLPCSDRANEVLHGLGTVIFLSTSVEVICQRLEIGIDLRPLYQGLNLEQVKQKTEVLLMQRTMYYQKADIIIDANGSIDDKINKVLKVVSGF